MASETNYDDMILEQAETLMTEEAKKSDEKGPGEGHLELGGDDGGGLTQVKQTELVYAMARTPTANGEGRSTALKTLMVYRDLQKEIRDQLVLFPVPVISDGQYTGYCSYEREIGAMGEVTNELDDVGILRA